MKAPVKVGDILENKIGLKYEILEYKRHSDITIRFLESGFTKKSTAQLLRKGGIIDPSYYVKEGEVYKNSNGTEFIVLEYKNARNVDIQFLDDFGYKTTTKALYVKSGIVRNPYDKTLLGIGFLGEDPLDSCVKNRKKCMSLWRSMLTRCYTEEYKNLTYAECAASDNFLNFKFFGEWANDQIGFLNEGWQLDKDIIFRGNKLYSENTCAFVPAEINTLVISCKSRRGKYPIGVTKHTHNTYSAQLSRENGPKFLGCFKTPEEAFYRYKEAKEDYIKYVANKWLGKIDIRVYNSLMQWEVEINE